MYEKFVLSAQTALAWFQSQVQFAHDWLDEARLLTPFQATVAMVVVALLMMWVIQAWLRYREIGKWKTAIASLAPVAFLAILFLVPSGFAGSPDENCTKYEDGKLTFTLLTFVPVPKAADEIYGDGWLVLVVQAKRWGDDTHQCRLSLGDDKVKKLVKILTDLQNDQASGYSRGSVTFTFGGKNEVPNVKIPPLDDAKKTAPPERPKAKQDI